MGKESEEPVAKNPVTGKPLSDANLDKLLEVIGRDETETPPPDSEDTN